MRKVLFCVVFVFLSVSFLVGEIPVLGQDITPDPGNNNKTIKEKNDSTACDPNKDIMLNTDIPFVGRCIKKTTDAGGVETSGGNVFAKLMAALTRIVMSVVVIVGFMAILVGGFMIAMGGADASMVSKGKGLILKALVGLALVGMTGLILHLSNPNFFKAATL